MLNASYISADIYFSMMVTIAYQGAWSIPRWVVLQSSLFGSGRLGGEDNIVFLSG